MMRVAALPEVGSYSMIRSFLNVYHPIFHATTMRQFTRILHQGIRADGIYPELGGQSGIPLTKNLPYLLRNPHGRPYILVLDFDVMQQRMSITDVGVADPDVGFIFSVRGVIPPKYIRGFIVGDRLYSTKTITTTIPPVQST